MSQLRLLLRALRWRLGGALALFVVGVVAVLAAAAGPLYLATANDSVLHSILASNPPAFDGITLVPRQGAGQVAAAEAGLQAAHQYGLSRWYRPQKLVLDAGLTVVGPSGAKFGSDLISDPGACGQLHFLKGSCPRSAGEVVLTDRSAQSLGAKVGSRLTTTIPGPVHFVNGIPIRTNIEKVVQVAGIVAVGNPSAPFWFGDDYFGFGQSCPPQAPLCLPQLDSMFTPEATISSVPGTLATDQLFLKVSSLHLSGAATFNRALGAFDTFANQDLQLTVSTQLTSLAAQANRENQLMQAIVLVVDLQLVLLALFVLFGLVARTAEARQKEVALAKLRGFRLPSVLSAGLLEPVAMLALAVPVGLLLAYLVVALVRPALLPGGQLSFQPLALVAALAAFAGGLVAVVFGAWRILTRKLVDDLRGVEPKSSSTARAALDAGGLALAVAGILELLASGVLNGRQPNPIAAFAPGLVAVALAILGMRLLPPLAQVVVRRTRSGGHLGLGLAVRQVVRRPASLRQVAVLAVAAALACFAVAGWAAAGVNRQVRADFALGAPRVLQVQLPLGLGLEAAVDRADPTGRYALAAMVSKIPSQNLIAVQASRLGRVGYWPQGISSVSLSRLVHWLTPHLLPEMVVRGKSLQAVVTMTGNPSPPPDLQLALVDQDGNPAVADFGFLSEGTHTYTAPLPAACVFGCHVSQLLPVWTQAQTTVPLQGPVPIGPSSARYQLTISSLEQNPGSRLSPVTSYLANPAYWSSSGPGMDVSRTSLGGRPALRLSVLDQASDTTTPSVYPGGLPAVLPGVVTVANSVQDPAAASVENFDGGLLTVNVRYQVAALPQLGGQGFLLDLSQAVRSETQPPSLTEDEVWLAKDAPASVVSRLKAQGIRILSSKTPAAAISAMNRGGIALAYLFFLFAAGAAAVLSMGAAVFSVFMSARRRAFELAVLRAIGLPEKALRNSLLGEQLMVLVPGVVLGVGAGLLGVFLALPSVPEFSSTAGSPPVELVLVPLPILLMLGLLVVLLLVAAVVSALATLRLASWSRLRTEIM